MVYSICALEQNTDNFETMETEGAIVEEPESEYPKESATDEMRVGDSEDEEEAPVDGGAISTDEEELLIGKKRPISRGRPRGKKIHHVGTFLEGQVHVQVRG